MAEKPIELTISPRSYETTGEIVNGRMVASGQRARTVHLKDPSGEMLMSSERTTTYCPTGYGAFKVDTIPTDDVINAINRLRTTKTPTPESFDSIAGRFHGKDVDGDAGFNLKAPLVGKFCKPVISK